MAPTIVQDYQQQLIQTILDLSKQDNWWSSPLNLGGGSGPDGGSGVPIGDIFGQLIQSKVAFDTTEAAVLNIPISGASLVTNLNRIRYRLESIESSGAVYKGVGIWDNNVFTASGVTDLNFVNMDVTVSGMIATISGGITVQWEDGHVASGVTILNFEGPGVFDVNDDDHHKVTVTISGGVSDHGALTGLEDDDHSQYALLAGRDGGQTLVGGTQAGDEMTITSQDDVVIDPGGILIISGNTEMYGLLDIEVANPVGNDWIQLNTDFSGGGWKYATFKTAATAVELSMRDISYTFGVTTGKVGVGTTSADNLLHIEGTDSSVNGPHWRATTTADTFPLIQNLNWTHDNIALLFDSYFDGTFWRSSHVGTNFRIYKQGGVFTISEDSGIPAGDPITWREVLYITSNDTIFNRNQLAKHFRISTPNELYMFHVDSNLDRIGIGTVFPQTFLQVSGAITGNSYFDFEEISEPATPINNFFRVYPKANGRIYGKNDAGIEYDLTISGATVAHLHDDVYVEVIGDEMTGGLLITGPSGIVPPASGIEMYWKTGTGFVTSHLAQNILPLALEGTPVTILGEELYQYYPGPAEYTKLKKDVNKKAVRSNRVAQPGTDPKGLDFESDGGGDELVIPDAGELRFFGTAVSGGEDFSVDVWIKLETAATSSSRTIMEKRGTVFARDWHIGITDDRKIEFGHHGDAAGNQESTGTVTVDEWTHIYVGYDLAGDNMYFGIGGTVESPVALAGTPGLASRYDDDITVGDDSNDFPSKEDFDGVMDEIRISNGIVRWTSNFTPSTERHVSDASTAILMHLDEGSGTAVEDSSSHGNDGTLTGGQLPAWVTGHITDPGTTIEPEVWSSESGISAGQKGIIKLGDDEGTTRVQGTEIEFDVGPGFNIATFKTPSGIYLRDLVLVSGRVTTLFDDLILDPLGDVVITKDTIIGTESEAPDGTLHVHTGSAGTVTANTAADDLVVEASTNAGISILSADVASIYFGIGTDNDLGFIDFNTNSEAMRFGVGTAPDIMEWAPGVLKLFPNPATFTSAGVLNIVAASDMNLTSSGPMKLQGATEVVFNEAQSDVDFRIESDTSQYMFDLDAASGTIVIDSSNTLTASDGTVHIRSATAGNVSASASANELILEGGGDTGVTILSPAANKGSLFFGSPNGAANGQIFYDHSAGQMHFEVNDAEVARFGIASVIWNVGGADRNFSIYGDTVLDLFFVDAGNDRIGISTTNPDGLLHVHTATAGSVSAHANADDFIIENSTTAGISILTPTNTSSYIMFGNPVGGNDEAYIQHNNGGTGSFAFVSSAVDMLHLTNTEVQINFNNVDMNFRVSSDTARRMFFVDGGLNRVLIEADNLQSAPDGTLHVKTSSSAVVTANTSADDLIVEAATNAGISIMSADVASLYFGIGTDNDLGFIDFNTATNLMRFGAGTVPDIMSWQPGTLSLGSTPTTIAAAGQLNINSPTVIVLNETAADMDFRIESSDATDIVFVDAGLDSGAGRVGINTSTPAYTLDVEGNVGIASYTDITEIADPSTPSANDYRIYHETDDRLYGIDDSGDKKALDVGILETQIFT